MATVKLTKTAVDSARATGKDYELRDTLVPGFLCKVTAAGSKVFMLQYRTNAGERRKPKIGLYGELTVDQARSIAQDWMSDIRKGLDPSAAKQAARQAPTVKDLCVQFIEEYSKMRNKPSTVETYQGQIDRHIVPELGRIKVPDLTRADVTAMMRNHAHTPTTANRLLACVRKMFNMAEVWGYRPDGSNPCRHVPKFREGSKTRYITDEELARLFSYLDLADEEGLEHPTLTLAIRLQFEFSARMSEICELEWSWVDFEKRRVVWPDSKTGGISKPMSERAYQLLSNALRIDDTPYVCTAIYNNFAPLPEGTYYNSWKRILERAGVPHVGTHGIRHRAATDIANSGVPLKVGMALTAHKTVSMFMTYVHTEDDPIRQAAEKVANLRQGVIDRCAPATQTTAEASAPVVTDASKTGTSQGNYRPYRHRKSPTRAVPPGTKRAAESDAQPTGRS
ncbi:tyrosine-type recombinase/integrase [Parapusillimonas sp. JC17]|uniref:tyrosine-type recombinase/integrase n=1 Tax=Parapusillimonas sp. JC17 TaxID=3445768 RepID=UPI003FA189C3